MVDETTTPIGALSLGELQYESEELPELGPVRVQGILMSQRMSLLQESDKDSGKYVTGLLARSVVDLDGKPVGTTADWDRYGTKYYEDAMRVFRVARRMIGIDSEDYEKNE